MKYTFHIVDVFSSTPFGGNQLAVLPDAAGISTFAVHDAHRGRTRLAASSFERCEGRGGYPSDAATLV